VDAYNEEQFKTITVQRLKQEKKETELAQYIAERIFDMGSTDVRDCIYLAMCIMSILVNFQLLVSRYITKTRQLYSYIDCPR